LVWPLPCTNICVVVIPSNTRYIPAQYKPKISLVPYYQNNGAGMKVFKRSSTNTRLIWNFLKNPKQVPACEHKTSTNLDVHKSISPT
jgi:hypothetical protein